MIEREETFVSCDHGTQLPGVVTHPEAFDHSNSIILRPVSTSFDAYQALVNIVIRSNTIKLSLIESEDGSSTPELPTSNASKSETGLTGRRAALTAELIDLYPDHAAQLLGLDSKLAEYEKGNRFTVANIVREFLKENRLLALEGPALSRVKELWPQDALAKSPR